MKRPFQRHSGIWTLGRLTALVLGLTLLGQACFGADVTGNTNGTPSTATDPAQTFRDFLSNPPWIKKIVYRRDRNYVVDKTDRKHPRREQGIANYEAALQQGGYYRKHLEGDRFYDPLPGTTNRLPVLPGKGISGASEQFFWRLWESKDSNSIALVPRTGQPGGSDKNWLDGFFQNELYELNRVRMLGFDPLADGVIKWVNNDYFIGNSSRFGRIEGRITHYTNGLPQTIQYTVNSSGTYHLTVRYRYLLGRTFPPYEVQVETVDPKGETVVHLNYIDELEIGDDPKAKHGYFPQDFRVDQSPFGLVQYSSNGILYHVDMQGRLHAVDTTYRPISSLDRPGSRVAAMVSVILISAVVCAFFIKYAKGKALKREQRD
jgi:hypothetical protein